jgi:hypothetical protein
MLRTSACLVGISLGTLACGSPPPDREDDPAVEATSSAESKNCDGVRCALVHQIPAGACGCFGGHMDAGTCARFGWSWDAKWEICWSGGSAGDCAYAQNKHRGDGSGRDIYNLGVTCVAR